MTVTEWGETWLVELRVTPKEERHPDLGNIESRYRVHIATAPFRDKQLNAVTRDDVVQWLHVLEGKAAAPAGGIAPKKALPEVATPGHRTTERPLSLETRKRILTVFRAMVDAAINDPEGRCQCTINAAAGVSIKTPKCERLAQRQRNVNVPLNVHEIGTLLGSYGNDPERYLPQFAIGTGLRQSEQWRLELKDVHLHVPRTDDPTGEMNYVIIRSPIREGNTKSVVAGRQVPLFGMGLQAMEEWLKVLPMYAPVNPLGLVFPTPKTPNSRGGYLRGKSQVPASWTARQKEAVLGVHREFWWDVLRQTCATALLSGWWGGRRWSIVEVADLLGQSRRDVAAKYACIVKSSVTDAVHQAQQAFDETEPTKPSFTTT